MVLVRWLLLLPVTPTVCCVPASTPAFTISMWTRDQTRLRALGQAQVELVAWTLKLWHASDGPEESGMTRYPDLWLSEQYHYMWTLLFVFVFYNFTYFYRHLCWTRLPYNEEWQRRLLRKETGDSEMNGGCLFLSSRATRMHIMAAPVGDSFESHHTLLGETTNTEMHLLGLLPSWTNLKNLGFLFIHYFSLLELPRCSIHTWWLHWWCWIHECGRSGVRKLDTLDVAGKCLVKVLIENWKPNRISYWEYVISFFPG